MPSPRTLAVVPAPPLAATLDHAARLRAQWPFAARDSEVTVIESLLTDDHIRAVYLFGQAGVGKTRLAAEVRARCEAVGVATVRIVGSSTSSSVPFASVAHLLTDRRDGTTRTGAPLTHDASNEAALLVAMVQRTVRSMGDASGAGRVVLFVDDAHLLDSLSAAVVSLLIANGDAKVVATVRQGEALHDAFSASLRSGEAARVDVSELTDHGMVELLRCVLDAPVERRALDAFRTRALGNVLYLRELLMGAVESNTLQLIDGTWRIDGTLSGTDRLTDLITARLSGLTRPDRDALELLALSGPLGLGLLEMLAPQANLEQLEEGGIITVHHGVAARIDVTFAHPLFGEAVRRRTSKLRGRSIRHALANAIELLGSQRWDDTLRVAVLRLDAGGQGDAVALARGAQLARYAHDFALAARLGRAAFTAVPTATSGLVLGEALYELGAFDEAQTVLNAALALATEQPNILAIGGQLMTVFFWGLGNDEAALATAEQLQSVLSDPISIAGLLGHRASLEAFSGRPSTAMALLDLLPPMTDPYDFCRLAVIRSITQVFVGRTEEGRAEATKAFELHVNLDEALSLPHPSTHVANEALALYEAGRPQQALERALVGYEYAIGDEMFVSPVWCQLVAGEACILLGRAHHAKQHFQTALNDARKRHFRGTVANAWAGIALSYAHLGNLAAAREALAESDAQESRLGVFEPNIAVARATVAVLGGAVSRATDELHAAATSAALGGNVGAEARVLHEMVRLGLAAKVVGRLVKLSAHSDSALVIARANHARAAAADDPHALAAVGDAFAQMGMVALASEVSAEAANAYRRRGDTRRATASTRLAATLLASCDTAPMPNSSRPDTLTPLTLREREVAYLAADGVSNKAIAEQLFVSTRTVENHLAKVFIKLGVSSRQDLLSALR